MVPLGALASRSTRKNVDREVTRVLTNSAEQGVVDQRTYFEKDIANQDNLEGYYVVDAGDYVYNPRISATAPVGPISRNNVGQGAMSPLYTVFRFNSREHDFYAQYFRSAHWHNYLRRRSSTGARHDRMSIANDVFMQMPVPLTTRAEQKRVSACLTSLDAVIAAQAQKLEQLKVHRKALIQQLFPLDDEAVPRLRFPEFADAGDWIEEKLETLANRGSGHTPSKSHPEYYNGGIKWISLADSKRLDQGLIAETEIEISEEGLANSSAVRHPRGTVVLSRDASVGKSAIMACSMAVSQHFIAWSCNPRRLNNWFLYFSLQRNKPLFERMATGSTIKTIGLPFFLELRIRVPSLAEQKRIAGCLSSLDDLIRSQARRLELTKQHKIGLLQQLFPVIEESML